MTFYPICSQFHQRYAVMVDVTNVQGRICPVPITFARTTYTICASRNLCVAAGSKVYVLNMLQYDSDSIAYFFIVLTPYKWIIFTVTQ